jgi:hypothetical protein
MSALGFLIALQKEGSFAHKYKNPRILLEKTPNRELCRRGVGLHMNPNMNRSCTERRTELKTIVSVLRRLTLQTEPSFRLKICKAVTLLITKDLELY